MFKIQPKVYAHVSALNNGNFVLQDKIIIKNQDIYDIKNRECPHRGYLMHTPGDVVKNVVCKLHGFAWNNEGRPLSQEPYCDHFYKLHHQGSASVGRSGLLLENFEEPASAEWVDILSKADNLKYSHSIVDKSTGSWLWLMEQMTDLLHVRQNGIHPRQSLETPLTDMKTSFGNGWALQEYPTCYNEKGFWLFVYPGFNIEYEPGQMIITRVTPDDPNKEFGYTWQMQFYYSDNIDAVAREAWEKCVEVYREDVKAVENIKRPFFPLKKTVNKWEEQMKHWGEWYSQNKIRE